MIKDSIEYKLISEEYGERTANRSKVPLINHINEGLIILDCIGATDDAKRAYCLHPLLQGDDDLLKNFNLVAACCSPAVVMLAMEYRSVANEYLSAKVNSGHIIRLSPMDEVNTMLVADKVQNYKDFIAYHFGTHPRSVLLDLYFQDWLNVLDISEQGFQSLCEALKNIDKT